MPVKTPIITATGPLIDSSKTLFAAMTANSAAPTRNMIAGPRAKPMIASAATAMATVTPMTYRHPGQLPEGGVLVVGASATGTQLADEIHRSGRPVTIAVGEHIRAPRVYRGRDIQWWMDAAGVLDERYDTVDDINRARGVPFSLYHKVRHPEAKRSVGPHCGGQADQPQQGDYRARSPHFKNDM